MLTDVEIAQSAEMKPIVEIAQKVGLDEDDLELYGKYKAKISLEAIKKLDQNEDGKLILVTAINPTPAGEGKTTTMIGLSQALNKLGKKSVVAMREPSLGPCFGIKGGAAGGGAQEAPGKSPHVPVAQDGRNVRSGLLSAYPREDSESHRRGTHSIS